MSHRSFSSRSSNHFPAQTKRAKELKFWQNGHPPPCVTCHVPRVAFHMSGVMCQVSVIKCDFYFFLFWQSCRAIWRRVRYHRGLPPLVHIIRHGHVTHLVIHIHIHTKPINYGNQSSSLFGETPTKPSFWECLPCTWQPCRDGSSSTRNQCWHLKYSFELVLLKSWVALKDCKTKYCCSWGWLT